MPRFQVGLYTRLPSQDDSGDEVQGVGYARVHLGPLKPSREMVRNEVALHFGEASSDWGVIVGIGIFDDAGHLLVSCAIVGGPIRILPGATLVIGEENLSISPIYLLRQDQIQDLLYGRDLTEKPRRSLWERLSEED